MRKTTITRTVTATGNIDIDVSGGRSDVVALLVSTTAAPTGTTPTLDITHFWGDGEQFVADPDDPGLPQFTTSEAAQMTQLKKYAPTLRLTATVGGTTPSYPLKITVLH